MRAVNLIPGEKRGDAGLGGGRSGGAAYAVLGVIAGLTILALLYGIASHQVSSRNSELASLNAARAADQGKRGQADGVHELRRAAQRTHQDGLRARRSALWLGARAV